MRLLEFEEEMLLSIEDIKGAFSAGFIDGKGGLTE